jgi:prolipoprotein diacylglyceryltransferase
LREIVATRREPHACRPPPAAVPFLRLADAAGLPPDTVLAVHPTQLYETAMGFIVVGAIRMVRRDSVGPGRSSIFASGAPIAPSAAA